jgi:CheY-like chemotaxis protein
MIDWHNAATWQVMIVDDEPDNIEVVAETLEYFGANVKTAQNGKEALDVLEDFSPNLILTDLSMPVMSGWEMRSRIKGNAKLADTPILAVSAHAIAGDQERALEAGFDGYLTKPINIHTLLDDIRGTLSALVHETPKAALPEVQPEAVKAAPIETQLETTNEAQKETI